MLLVNKGHTFGRETSREARGEGKGKGGASIRGSMMKATGGGLGLDASLRLSNAAAARSERYLSLTLTCCIRLFAIAAILCC